MVALRRDRDARWAQAVGIAPKAARLAPGSALRARSSRATATVVRLRNKSEQLPERNLLPGQAPLNDTSAVRLLLRSIRQAVLVRPLMARALRLTHDDARRYGECGAAALLNVTLVFVAPSQASAALKQYIAKRDRNWRTVSCLSRGRRGFGRLLPARREWATGQVRWVRKGNGNKERRVGK